MELEEAIKNLKDEINVDKNNLPIAEANEYEEERTLMLNRIEAKETILNHLTKQEKMIELMALAISSYDGQLVINQYKDRNDVKEKFEEYVEDGTYEQYFEKKAEENNGK